MSRWFRFYAESLDDPKVQKLPPHLFKTWVNLLCIASANDGVLPPAEDLSFRLRMSNHDMQSQIDELIGLGLLDIRNDKTLEPHNWMKRQFVSDTSTRRVRKHREEKKKQARNVCETLHETAPDTETDTETEQNPPLAPPDGGARRGLKIRLRKRDRQHAFAAALAKYAEG